MNTVHPDDPIAVAFRKGGKEAALKALLDAERAEASRHPVQPRPVRRRGPSPLEELFAAIWAEHGNGYAPEREFKFALSIGRKWRFDFAFPEVKLAVECEGVTRGKPGRHQRCDGVTADARKYNAAVLLGWRVLRYTGQDLRKRPEEVAAEVAKLLEAAR